MTVSQSTASSDTQVINELEKHLKDSQAPKNLPDLDESQTQALEIILAWFWNYMKKRKPESKRLADFEKYKNSYNASKILGQTHQFLRLGGLAGTGKTTIQAWLRHELGNEFAVSFNALTGKATNNTLLKVNKHNVLRTFDHASTIHSILYKPIIDVKTGKILDWELRDASTMPIFDLFSIDEASMVIKIIHEDLLILGFPILYIGDHGQLPPIQPRTELPFNLMTNPDIKLEKPHRTAADNPIIQLAMKARYGQGIPIANYSDKVRKVKSVLEVQDKLTELNCYKKTMLITDTNFKRTFLNRRFRVFRSQSDPEYKERLLASGVENHPVVGDKVICLKNSKAGSRQIFNGMLGQVLQTSLANGTDMNGNFDFKVRIDGETLAYDGKSSVHFFNNPKNEAPADVYYKSIGDRWDFGYALTAHKAQGSEEKRVFIFGDGKVFTYTDKNNPDIAKQWLYTAITRASEELYICQDKITKATVGGK